MTRDELENKMTVLLGGRAAESIVFGERLDRRRRRPGQGHRHRPQHGHALRHGRRSSACVYVESERSAVPSGDPASTSTRRATTPRRRRARSTAPCAISSSDAFERAVGDPRSAPRRCSPRRAERLLEKETLTAATSSQPRKMSRRRRPRRQKSLRRPSREPMTRSCPSSKSRGMNGEARRGRMSLSVAFGLAIGGLLVVAVGAVLAVSLWGASANTRSLLSDKTHLILSSAVSEIQRRAGPGRRHGDLRRRADRERRRADRRSRGHHGGAAPRARRPGPGDGIIFYPARTCRRSVCASWPMAGWGQRSSRSRRCASSPTSSIAYRAPRSAALGTPTWSSSCRPAC